VSSGVIVACRVTPRGGRDSIEGVSEDGQVRIRVAVPPADGAANKAVCRLVAKTLKVPRGAVSVVAGATSRHKRLRIEGVTKADIEARWSGANISPD
jgi:uncharacterized protein (TIGR00251 family)